MMMKRKLPSQQKKLEEELLKKPETVQTPAAQPQVPESVPQHNAASTVAPEPGSAPTSTPTPEVTAEVTTEVTTKAAPQAAPQATNNTPPQNIGDTAQAEQTIKTEIETEITPTEGAVPLDLADQENMTLDAPPPQRPKQAPADTAPQEPFTPRRRNVSTTSLLETFTPTKTEVPTQPPVEATPQTPPNKDVNTLFEEGPYTGQNKQTRQTPPKTVPNAAPNTASKGPANNNTNANTQAAQQPPATPTEEDPWDLTDLIQIPQEAQNVGTSPFAAPPTQEQTNTAANPTTQATAQTAGAAGANTGPQNPQEGTPQAKKTPWNRKPAPKKRNKTILPKAATENAAGGRMLISLGLVIIIVGGTFLFYQNKEVAVEKVTKWTGTFNEIGQPVPFTETEESEALHVETLKAEEFMPEATTSLQHSGQLNAQANIQANTQANIQANTQNIAKDAGHSANTPTPQAGAISLEVLDVPPEEATKPIVANGSEEIPAELDKFSALQEAIARKRAEKRSKNAAKLATDTAENFDPATLSRAEMTRRNLEVIRQTNDNLEQYKKALAKVNDPALKPSPSEFLQQQRNAQAGLLPPPTPYTDAHQNPQQRQQLYGNKVVDDLAELATEEPLENDGVRNLEDFDLTLFERSRPRVSVPRGLVPSLSTDSFPPLEVLSFVAGQGLIAKAHNQEGILLIGETLEGWELITVQHSYAEFQKNGNKRIVTLHNGNR